MAKTIIGMALDKYPYRFTANNRDKRKGFIEGANAMLDEIDEICCQSDKTYEERYLMITDLIKRLKGE